MQIPEVDGAVVAVGPVEEADDARLAVAVRDGHGVGVDETRQRDRGRHEPDDEDDGEYDAGQDARTQRVDYHRVPATKIRLMKALVWPVAQHTAVKAGLSERMKKRV